MSLSKLVLVLTLLIFALPANADGSKGSAAKSSASGDKGGSDGGEKKSGKSNKKMALEGGLYTTDKVKVIKSNKNRPSVRLISPMQRSTVSKSYEGEDAEKYGSYTASDLNPFLRPCGGTKPGKVHFTAEMESKAFIAWSTKVPDETGNCTIKLSDGADD